MKFQAIALSDVGRHRKNNEDNLYFKQAWRKPEETAKRYKAQMSGEERRTLFAICDGMGGEALGEQASHIAVSGLKVLEDRFNNVSGQAFPKLMDHYIARTNETICQYIQDNSGLRMGTTFTCMLLGRHVAQVINVGDSMAFLYREGLFYPLTQKHTHVQRLLDMGIITESEAVMHPDRHRLTQHLGLFPEEKNLEPSVTPEIWIKADDIFMLCSDGITEMLSMQQIESLLNSGGSLEDIGDRMLAAALEAGGKDNASLILVSVVESNPIVKDIHPDAVENGPFELLTLSHAERSKPVALKSFSVPKKSITEEISVKKKSENEIHSDTRQNNTVRPSGGSAAPTAQSMTNPARPSQSPPVSAPTAAQDGLQPKKTYALSSEDQERFSRAQAEAASRQQARKVSSAPIKVSSAYEEEQLWQQRQLQKQNGERTGINWNSLLKNLIFLILFVGIGYGAAWLLVNFSVIRSFFQNLIG